MTASFSCFKCNWGERHRVLDKTPPRQQDGKRVSLATSVKRNMVAFEARQFPTTAAKGGRDGKKRQTKDLEEERLRRQVEAKIQDGNIGAVRLLSSDEAVTIPDANTLEALHAKHPPDKDNPNYPPAAEGPPGFVGVTSTEVSKTVQSFPNGSAQHLKDMLGQLKDDASMPLCEALAKFVNLILEGKVPTEICPVLYGGSLTALKKKDGGIQPITVGNTLRRTAGKIICSRKQKLEKNYEQLDVGPKAERKLLFIPSTISCSRSLTVAKFS